MCPCNSTRIEVVRYLKLFTYYSREEAKIVKTEEVRMKCIQCGEDVMKTGEAVAEFHPLDGSSHKNIIWDVYGWKNSGCTYYN
jgi:hypothetical protein